MYADDTSLYYQSPYTTQLNKANNNDVTKLESWLKSNKLSLNAMRTQSMLISTKQRQPVLKNLDQKLSLDIRDHELEVVEKNRYFGLQMDNSLDWKCHISLLPSKVSKAVGFLKHAKPFLPRETLLSYTRE